MRTYQLYNAYVLWSSTSKNREIIFASEKFIALALPSVLVPEEFNLVINPSHKNFDKILGTAKLLGQHSAPVRHY